MSLSPVSTITRRATRKPEDKLNILTGLTHARYETGLALTGHNFYAFGHDSFIGRWASEHAVQPDNYQVLDKNLKEKQIPQYLDFDLVLSQNKFGQFQVLSNIANQLQLPLVSLEHTLPVPAWSKATLMDCQNMRGCVNVFISEYSIGRWGWEVKDDTRVIKHCVDTNKFCPLDLPRMNHILTVVNDYVNRDWCCNFTQYKKVTEGLPVFPVGDTNGLSRPAESTNQLIEIYNRSSIFLNTAHISPIPTSLLEAMSCGCACVSCKASDIPSYIEHGVNGFLAETDEEMRRYLEMLLTDEALARQFGEEARKTILEKCSVARFVQEWDEVFRHAANGVFR